MLTTSLVCVVVGLGLVLILFADAWDSYGENLPGQVGLLLVVDVAVGALANLAAGPMRRAGWWNLLLVAPAALSGSALPAAAVGLARVGTRRDRRGDVAGLAVCASAGLFYSGLDRWAVGQWSSTLVIDLLLGIVFGVLALLWGRIRGTRAMLVTSLRRQAATAQREREAVEREHEALAREHRALVAQAESEQRAEIARDMHDSLSHHLSLIAMHAGALSYREDMPPETMREVAATILGDARAANSELRHVLTALRPDDAEPLPTGAHVLEQVERARADGQDVRLTWQGTDARDLDTAGSAVVVTLSRAVREMLTNARKHAPGLPLTLTIIRAQDLLQVTATNPARSTSGDAPGTFGAGLGLTGMRERVRLLGGTSRIRTREDGVFAVELSLPWSDSGSKEGMPHAAQR